MNRPSMVAELHSMTMTTSEARRGSATSLSPTVNNLHQERRRRKSARRSMGFGGLLGSNSTYHDQSSAMEDDSSSMFLGDNHTKHSTMCRSLPGTRSRFMNNNSDSSLQLDDEDVATSSDCGSPRKARRVRKLSIPTTIKRNFSGGKRTPRRSMSGKFLQRATQVIHGKKTAPDRTTDSRSPSPSAESSIPDLSSFISDTSPTTTTTATRPSPIRRAKTMDSGLATPTNTPPTLLKPAIVSRHRSLEFKARKTVSISPPPPSRRDTPPQPKSSEISLSSLILNPNGQLGQLIDLNESDDTINNDPNNEKHYASFSSIRPKAPLQRTTSGTHLSNATMLRLQRKTNLDTINTDHNNSYNSFNSMSLPRVLPGRSKSSIAGSILPNNIAKRSPPSRSKSGVAASMLRRGSITLGDGALGRSVRATKSACSDLANMQFSLVRRSRSGNLSEFQKSMHASFSTTTDQAVTPDPLFQQMVTWNPMDPLDRPKYNDAHVQRCIKRNPDALRAKYTTQVGRALVQRSALSTIIALGASLDTIRYAIKANPSALKPSPAIRSTPLHTACSFDTNLPVIQYIYHKYPQAIRTTTQHVFLPLHNACQKQHPSLPIIEFLVQAYPEGLTQINKLGDTPYRTALRNKTTPTPVLQFLQTETERVFGRNETKRRQIELRQSWGQSQLSAAVSSLGDLHLLAGGGGGGGDDNTDGGSFSGWPLDASENYSTSGEFECADDSFAAAGY